MVCLFFACALQSVNENGCHANKTIKKETYLEQNKID